MKLIVGLFVKPTVMRRILEGRRQQIKFETTLILSASFEENTLLTQLAMIQAKTTPPIASKCKSYFYSQQQARKLWAMKAPAKPSTPNRTLSILMLFLFSGLMPIYVVSSLSQGASISLRPRQQYKIRIRQHSTAQIFTTLIIASIFESSVYLKVSSANIPAKAAPKACETYPVISQYPKTVYLYLGAQSLLSTQLSINCERADCSMDMKGPISQPVTVMNPSMPLNANRQSSLVNAQMMAVTSMNKDAMARAFTLPMQLAQVVKMRDLMMLLKTMPACIHDASQLSRPIQKSMSKKTTASIPKENILTIRVMKSSTKYFLFC